MANQEKRLWDDLCYDLFHGRDSVFVAMDGFNQIGKTDLFLSIMAESFNRDYFNYFGLNQQISNAPFKYDFIHDLDSLFARVETLKKPYLYYLDELGKALPRAIPWNKLTLELITKMEVKRKEKLSLLGSSIGDVDRRIMSPNYLDVYIRKTSLTTARVTHHRKHYTITLTNIPRTTIKFSEFKVALFTLHNESNDNYEPPILKRFRLYKEGKRESEIWDSRQQKKREILKLYELVRNKGVHIDSEVNPTETVTKSTT